MAVIERAVQIFEKALRARAPLLKNLEASKTNTYRAFRGAADGIEGLIIDKFGSVLWVQWRENQCPLQWEETKTFFQAVFPFLQSELEIQSVYLKRYIADRSKGLSEQESEWVLGEKVASVTASENATAFKILPEETQSPGLFLDQRNNREWVLKNSKEKRVLNLFAYTGAFSVMAAKGGAREVVTVDTSKKALEIARENFTLNQLTIEPHRFYVTGALTFLRKAKKLGEKYDLVLLDPPVFSRSKVDGVFSLKEDLKECIQLCAEATVSEGSFFFSTNWQQKEPTKLKQELEVLLPNWKHETVPIIPEDFVGTENPISTFILKK